MLLGEKSPGDVGGDLAHIKSGDPDRINKLSLERIWKFLDVFEIAPFELPHLLKADARPR